MKNSISGSIRADAGHPSRGVETGSFILKNIENKKDFWKKIYNNFVLLFVRFDMGMCGGTVFSVSASRSPVPGSILGPGPPHSVV